MDYILKSVRRSSDPPSSSDLITRLKINKRFTSNRTTTQGKNQCGWFSNYLTKKIITELFMSAVIILIPKIELSMPGKAARREYCQTPPTWEETK